MKKLALLIATVFCLNAYSQTQSQARQNRMLPKEEWQIGFSPFAMASNILKFEVHKKVTKGHYLGLQGGPLVGDVYLQRWESLSKPVRGTFLKAVHKAYLIQPEDLIAFYAEHGFFIQDSKADYPGTAWETYTEEGVEYMRAVEADQTFSTFRMGYDVSFGMEFRLDFFYLDLSMGLGYVNKLSTEEPPQDYDFNNIMYGINYQGFRVLPALKLGYLIP